MVQSYSYRVSNVLEVFEPWLRAYVKQFSYKSLSTDEWKEFLYSFFHDKVTPHT